MKKRVVLFGTRHYTASNIPAEIRNSLAVIIDEFRPDIALEEWSVVQVETSGAAVLCASKNVSWESIGLLPKSSFGLTITLTRLISRPGLT